MKQNIVLILLLLVGLGAIVAIVLHLRSEFAPPPSIYDIPEGRYDCLALKASDIIMTPGFPRAGEPKVKVPETLMTPEGEERPLPDSLPAAFTMSQAPPFTADMKRTFQGIDFQIAIYHRDPSMAEFAAEQAFRRIETIVQNMDALYADGELARINGEAFEAPVPLSDDMYFVLKRSQMLAIHSTRAFDVTVGPARRMWMEAARKRDLPSRFEKDDARSLISFNYLVIDDENRTIRFKKQGVMIDLTGLLRGFAVDQGARVLRDQGVSSGFVRSREVYHFIGRIAEDKPFRVAILRPMTGEQTLRFAFDVDRPGCATYGYFMANAIVQGEMITEGLDGRTGDPALAANSCTIVGPDAMTSQMLAHAVCALGTDKAYRFINKFNPEDEAPPSDEELREEPKPNLAD